MDAKELFREGQIFFVEGKYAESIASFSKAIEAGEKTEIAFLSRGVAYFRMEQFDKAAEDFNVVIEHEQPELPGPLLPWHNVYGKKGL